ncbi:hypothetical protein [Mariniflexile sp. AS56]|uniref:hypothetical protein n=1 Tax=Mariniflexile sp. AS56 TaxID=3063957 RepID=UPI0026F1C66D|nr:hypothetical protein [Mariniflexile sp. AS56]MDO7171755.1 hypothetical protein [Mariniflexile sp. AS56]
MATVFDVIKWNYNDVSLVKESSILKTSQQDSYFYSCIDALYIEIELTTDVLYLSYNTLRKSPFCIKVSDWQMAFYELSNKLSSNVNSLLECFSHILSITGHSYNKFENIGQPLTYLKDTLNVIRLDELLTAIALEYKELETEDKEVRQVFELLLNTFKSVSLYLDNFNNAVDQLLIDYNEVNHASTNLKNNASQNTEGFAFKFQVHTLFIVAVLKKYVDISSISMKRNGELIGENHLTINEANQQLNQLTADLKTKWKNRFQE